MLVINQAFFRLSEIMRGIAQQLRAVPWYYIRRRFRLRKRQEKLKTNYRALEMERDELTASGMTGEASPHILGQVYRPGTLAQEREIDLWTDSERGVK